MTPDDVKKSFAGGAVAPLYFFYGDNVPQLEAAVREVAAVLFPSGGSELDIKQLDAQKHSPADILQAARTASFTAPKKLVIVRQAHLFKEAQWQQLQPYLKKPAASCCLVFMLTLDAKDKKEKARLESLKKFGSAYAFLNPKGERQIALYVREQLARAGKSIEPEALAYFSAILAEDAQAIAGEVEKLVLYCGERSAVTAADIDEVASGAGRGSIFNLVDAIGQGRIAESLELLGIILSSGGYPLVVVKMIARQFRLLAGARQLLEKGENAVRIAQRLKLPEFVVRGIIQQSRGWPAERLGVVFDEVFKASNLIKSSRAEARTVLEHLLLRLQEIRA